MISLITATSMVAIAAFHHHVLEYSSLIVFMGGVGACSSLYTFFIDKYMELKS